MLNWRESHKVYMTMLLVIALVPFFTLMVYFGYRYWIGYQIADRMKQFSVLYDSHNSAGALNAKAFALAVEVFKKCRPFDKLTETEWENICFAFSRLEDPKRQFLRTLIHPSRKVMECLRNPEFLRDIATVGIRHGNRN